MSLEHVELVRRWFAFLDQFGGQVEPDQIADWLPDAALGEFLDPEIEWVPIPQAPLAASSYTGFEGFRHWVADFIAAWDEIHVEPQEFLDRGDQVIVVVRVRGRARGLEIDELWSSVLTHRDGRLIRIQNFGTPEGALEASGLRE